MDNPDISTVLAKAKDVHAATARVRQAAADVATEIKRNPPAPAVPGASK